MTQERPGAAARLAREAPWLLAIAVGVFLRGFRLLDQVPVDDEWHSLHGLLLLDYAQLATSFGPVDRCIPFTLYLKVVADLSGLGDVALRLPSFAVGVATLVVLPLLAREQLGRRGSHVFAGLLAVAPLLVLYSRYARPYDVAALLAFVSLALFERWWRTSRWPSALGYGACAALAGWFLPVALPFALAPLLVLGAFTLAREPRALLRRVGAPVLATFAFAAPLLGPPLLAHPEAVTAKLGVARPDLAGLARAAGFWLGVKSPWLGGLLLALAALGATRLWRRARIWTSLALGSSAVLAIGVFVAAPSYAWLGFVIARYAIPALPVFLVCVAAGVVQLTEGLRWRGAPVAAGAALCALLLAAGGVASALLDTRAWFPARWITQMEGDVATPRRVPAFYRELAAEPPGSVTLVESPWYYSLWNSLLPAYERVHRQRTLVGFSNPLCSGGHWGEYPPDAGLELRSFVHLGDDAALRERGVRYVVLHRDLDAEMQRVIDPIDAETTGHPDIRPCIEAYRRRGWPEIYTDPHISVFEVPVSR